MCSSQVGGGSTHVEDRLLSLTNCHCSRARWTWKGHEHGRLGRWRRRRRRRYCVLHSRCRLRLLGWLNSGHTKHRIRGARSRDRRSAKRTRLSEEAIRTVNCAGRRGHCNGLVDLNGRRVVLVGRLLVLLSLTKLPFSLLCFYLNPLFLLGCILHDLSFPVFALSHLPLAIWVRLIRCWAVLMLQGLRDAG
jgi:hypothetical protein